MQYEDKVFLYIKNDVKPGEKVLISKLSSTPDLLINAVKFLMDAKYIVDIEFSNDYKYIKKLWPLKSNSQSPYLLKK